MKLYINPTSPFVRLTRMAIIEKGLADAIELRVVDAWADLPEFLEANPAGRVPALVLDDGTKLTECSLILRWLDAVRPDPALIPAGAAGAACLSRAGVATGVFEAAVSVIIGRKSAPGFDHDLVGTKRFRTMRDGLERLEATLPAGDRPFDLADMASIVALDYLVLRFPGTDWRADAPKLTAFHLGVANRPSVRDTAPA